MSNTVYFSFVIALITATKSAPVSDDIVTTLENEPGPRAAVTTPQPPIQQWFNNLASNQTILTNSLQELQKWFANLSGNSDTNNPFGNILGGNGGNQPIMIIGSYQALKIPLPQIGDIIKNLNNFAQLGGNFNQLMQGNLPQLLGNRN